MSTRRIRQSVTGGSGVVWLIGFALLLAVGNLGAADPAEEKPGAKTDEKGEGQNQAIAGRVEMAPGVLVDFHRLVVELDTRVVLRNGPLELLACSPQTREHESILAVRGRPLHIYQALGLIGLEPGAPARYDPKEDEWYAATGQPLRIDIQYRDRDGEHTVPAHRWLYDLKHEREAKEVPWVFAGSRQLENDRFFADMEGTVICIVDFAAALIAVGEAHSADNALLWATANTDRIPPVGTDCRLIIRAADRIVVKLNPRGGLEIDGVKVAPEAVARMVEESPHKSCKIVLTVQQPRKKVKDMVAELEKGWKKAGVELGKIEVRYLGEKG